MGVGTLIVEPLSYVFYRLKVITIGLLFDIAMGLLAFVSSKFEIVFAAHFFRGFGVAASRIVLQANIYDLFSRLRMTQLISIVIVVFVLTPALAPLFRE